MANHFSALGFNVHSKQELGALANYALQDGAQIESLNGDYIWWSPGRGIELWFQINPQKRVMGMNPHFSHNARMKVGLTQLITRSTFNVMEGAFYGWANPQENGEGDYPFVFDLPDFDLQRHLSLPAVKEVQIAAFAHKLTIFGDETSYQASQSQLAPQSFIPMGLFQQIEGEEIPANVEPTAMALLSGRIVTAEQLKNPFTNLPFYWAKIETFGGELDMVAAPELVTEELKVGGIVQGTFWLSGRIQS